MSNNQEQPEQHPLGNLRTFDSIKESLFGPPGSPLWENFEKAVLQEVAEVIATGSASPITADDIRPLTIITEAEYGVAVIERNSLSEATDPIQKARYLQLVVATDHYNSQRCL